MTITMPQGLQDLASVVVGADFPEGDEDALRRLGEAWATCAGEVEGVLEDTEAAIKDALSTMEGQTADAFKEFGESLTNGEEAPLPALQKLCEKLGEACDNVALEVEYTKISIITALSILFAQIAVMIAMAAVTFGASTAAIPAAQAATQAVTRSMVEVLKQIIMKVIQEVIKQIAINMAMNLTVDGMIQLGQMGAGDRKEWDTSKTGAAALSGVAAGIAGGAVGGLLGGATKGLTNGVGEKIGDAVGDKFGSKIGGQVGGKVQWGGAILGGAGVGAGAGTLGAALNNEFQPGGEQTDQSLGAGAAGGAIGGGMGGAHGYKTDLDNFTPGSSFDKPGLNSSDSGTSGPGWSDWDSAPPKDTDVTDLVGGGEQWKEWDGAPPIDTDVTDLVGPGTPPPPPGLFDKGGWSPNPSDYPPHMVPASEDRDESGKMPDDPGPPKFSNS